MDVGKLAKEIGKYLETGAALRIQGAIPEAPMGKREKGTSRTPASKAYEEFSEANRIPASYIDWRVASLRRTGTAYRGIRFAAILGALDGDPGCVARWQTGREEWERDHHEAWEKMCRLVAQNIVAEHPDLQLNIALNPKHEKADDPREAAYRDRKTDTRYAYREIAEHVEEVEQGGRVPREEAKERVAKERGISRSKIGDALKWCKFENDDPDNAARAWYEATRRGQEVRSA